MKHPLNPYTAGVPVGKLSSFVGREDVLREVVRLLRHPKQNAITLFGQRRIGKTSILQWLEVHLPEEGPYHPIYFDLMGYSGHPLGELLRALAEDIAHALSLPAPDLGQEPERTFSETWLSATLKALPPGMQIVLLMDEFDIQADPQTERRTKQAFFHHMRKLLRLDPQQLQFIFVLGRTIDDLDIVAKGLFKDLPSKHVSLFSYKETQYLIRLSERAGSLMWEEAAIEQVWTLAGGHPYLTQAICAEVWEAAYETYDEIAPPPPVQAADVETAIPATLERSEHMFTWLWDGLGPAEKVVAAALASAGPVIVDENRLSEILAESGVRILIRELRNAPRLLQKWDILSPAEGGYRFRVELLRRWVAENRPLDRVQDELDRIHPLADLFYQAGHRLFERGNLQGATNSLKQALESNPSHMAARELLGEIYLIQGKLDKAQEELEHLQELAPGRARARLKQIYLQRVEHSEATAEKLEWYEKVLQLFPDDPDARRGLQAVGEQAMKREILDEALHAFQMAGAQERVAEVERRLQEQEIQAKLKQITGLEKAKDYETAWKRLQALAKQYPKARDWTSMLQEMEAKARLKESYRQAVEAFRQGKREEAKWRFAQIVALDPDYEDASRYLYQCVDGGGEASKDEWPFSHLGSGATFGSIAFLIIVLIICVLSTTMLFSFPNLPTPIAATTSSILSPPTVTPLPTSTPTLTITPSPAPTLTPTTTPSPTPTPTTNLLPLSVIPATREVISASNASSLTQLARWGKGTINHLMYAPDGKLLAVASSSGIYFYDAQTLKETRYIATSFWVDCVAFSPDAHVLASGSDDGIVRLWYVADGSLLRTLDGHTDWIDSVVFSPDGQVLASGSDDGTVRLWHIADGSLLRILTGHTGAVRSVAFSPDGQVLASGSDDGTVRLWRVADGSLLHTLKGHTSWVWSIAFSPDGQTLASGSADHTVRLWRVADGSLLHTLTGHTAWVGSVAFSPDGQILASGSGDGTVRLWRVADGFPLRALTGHTQWIWGIAFSPDGQTLASGSNDGTLRLWHVANGAPLRILKGYVSWELSIAFSPDGQILASGSRDNAVRLWRVTDGSILRIFTGHTGAVRSVAFSPNGQILASGSGDDTVRLWNIADGSLLHTLTGHTGTVRSVAFSPDGQILASGSGDDTVRLWRVADGSSLHTLTGHTGDVESVSFSPTGQTLASTSADGTIRLWNVVNGSLLYTLKDHTGTDWVFSIAFSPDGQTLASGSGDGTVRLWRVADGSLLYTFTGHTGAVRSVAFSPDGQVLASGSEDHTVRLWDVTHGTLLRTLKGHTSWVFSITFSPDGTLLTSASGDGTVRLWGIPSQ